jgi:NAD-dependent SIR2 family protein deacetylase
MSHVNSIVKAAQIILSSKALVISAGAGMGVDSGLPDFRGTQGFWKAYPPLQKLGIDFVNAANPRLFETNPRLAWAFYGHRKNLYANTTPHAGFGILKKWADKAQHGHYVYTSNVDGAFQKAGFKSIVECHGSIHHVQCTELCNGIHDFNDSIDVDMDAFQAKGSLPTCESCGRLARPNILMFGDGYWQDARTKLQRLDLKWWMSTLNRDAPIALIELGAGTDIPSIRSFNAQVKAVFSNARLIRINPRECEVEDDRDVGISLGALDALKRIDDIV